MHTNNKAFIMFFALFAISAMLIACSSEEEKPKEKIRNATISVFVQEESVTPGGTLRYNMTIKNVGDAKDYDIAVEHRMFSSPLGRVIKTEGEIVRLDQPWIYKDKQMTIPADSPTGDYQITVYISYGENRTAETGSFFNIVKPVEELLKKGETQSAGNNSVQGSDASATANQSVSGAASTNLLLNTTTSSSASQSTPTGAAASIAVQTLPGSGKEVIIEHKGRQFVPDKVTIAPGTTVVWIQRDKTSGGVAGSGFSSGPLGVNKEFRHTFNKIGIFDFYSQLTKAFGTITVDDPDNPTLRKRDPTSFKGGLNS